MIADFYYWWVPVMAQAGGDAIPPAAVGTIIAAVVTAMLGGGFITKKVAEKQRITIDPPQLEIDLKEKFVTRREFEKHEADVLRHLTRLESTMTVSTAKMEGLFERTMDALEKRDKATTAKIEAVASGAYRGRQKLWEQTNENREDIAGLKATSDVANQIGKLAEAIQPKTPAKPRA